MIIHPSEARSYTCCADPRLQCKGVKCMAWKSHLVVDHEAPHPVRPPASFMPRALKDSGMGYCGLVK